MLVDDVTACRLFGEPIAVYGLPESASYGVVCAGVLNERVYGSLSCPKRMLRSRVGVCRVCVVLPAGSAESVSERTLKVEKPPPRPRL